MVTDKYEPSTDILRPLKRALRLVRTWGLIKGVPAIEMLSGENAREFVLGRQQQKEYLAVCPKFLRNWAEFAPETDMRRKDLHSLQWPNVFFDAAGKGRRGYIQARETKSKNLAAISRYR